MVPRLLRDVESPTASPPRTLCFVRSTAIYATRPIDISPDISFYKPGSPRFWKSNDRADLGDAMGKATRCPKMCGVQPETRVAGFFAQRSPPPITFFDDRDVASLSALEAFQSD